MDGVVLYLLGPNNTLYKSCFFTLQYNQSLISSFHKAIKYLQITTKGVNQVHNYQGQVHMYQVQVHQFRSSQGSEEDIENTQQQEHCGYSGL